MHNINCAGQKQFSQVSHPDAEIMRLLLMFFVLAIGCSTISHYDAFHKEQRESRFEVGFL